MINFNTYNFDKIKELSLFIFLILFGISVLIAGFMNPSFNNCYYKNELIKNNEELCKKVKFIEEKNEDQKKKIEENIELKNKKLIELEINKKYEELNK